MGVELYNMDQGLAVFPNLLYNAFVNSAYPSTLWTSKGKFCKSVFVQMLPSLHQKITVFRAVFCKYHIFKQASKSMEIPFLVWSSVS